MTGATVHKLDIASPGIAERSAPGPVACAVERLTLTNFRCYDHARLDAGCYPAVLTGINGAGKTNILEALSLLTPGRGLRRAGYGEIARRYGGHTAGEWAIAARVRGPSGAVDLGTGVVAGGDKRSVRIDGQTVRGQSTLGEHLTAHWLTPVMDRLFVEGRTGRRRFFDRLVFNIDRAHAGRINAYDQALRERSLLLRDGIRDSSWLAALEKTLADKGVAVAAARLDLIARLRGYAEQPSGPFPGAALSVSGDVEGWLGEAAAVDVEDHFRMALADSRAQDADVGGASLGPHRSDFHVCHLPSGQTADLCSTGEQKALLIAIVIGSTRMAAAECGRLPMLLLDEGTAHLDPMRRDALFALLRSLGAQVWMTGTDASQFADLRGHARFFDVANAHITPAD